MINGSHQLIASNRVTSYAWTSIKLVKFSLLHAKNIRRNFGVPIWFSSTDAFGNAVPFVQLVYLWATISTRFDDDPFLSYRADDRYYINKYNRRYNLWLDILVRMSAPTIAAAAKAQTKIILQMGRWASEPSALLYPHQSTAANNNMLSIVSDPTLFTSDDILLSRVLASRAPGHQPTIRRYA